MAQLIARNWPHAPAAADLARTAIVCACALALSLAGHPPFFPA